MFGGSHAMTIRGFVGGLLLLIQTPVVLERSKDLQVD